MGPSGPLRPKPHSQRACSNEKHVSRQTSPPWRQCHERLENLARGNLLLDPPEAGRGNARWPSCSSSCASRIFSHTTVERGGEQPLLNAYHAFARGRLAAPGGKAAGCKVARRWACAFQLSTANDAAEGFRAGGRRGTTAVRLMMVCFFPVSGGLVCFPHAHFPASALGLLLKRRPACCKPTRPPTSSKTSFPPGRQTPWWYQIFPGPFSATADPKNDPHPRVVGKRPSCQGRGWKTLTLDGGLVRPRRLGRSTRAGFLQAGGVRPPFTAGIYRGYSISLPYLRRPRHQCHLLQPACSTPRSLQQVRTATPTTTSTRFFGPDPEGDFKLMDTEDQRSEDLALDGGGFVVPQGDQGSTLARNEGHPRTGCFNHTGPRFLRVQEPAREGSGFPVQGLVRRAQFLTTRRRCVNEFGLRTAGGATKTLPVFCFGQERATTWHRGRRSISSTPPGAGWTPDGKGDPKDGHWTAGAGSTWAR